MGRVMGKVIDYLVTYLTLLYLTLPTYTYLRANVLPYLSGVWTRHTSENHSVCWGW